MSTLATEHATRTEETPTPPVFRIRRSLDEEDGPGRARLRRVIARAQDGDRGALHDLYERYASNVFSYVRTIVHDEHEAEDVTQHVFTKLLTRIDSYEERSVPFAAWLLRIARNCAIDHVRSNRAICCEDVAAVDRRAYDEIAADRRHAIEEALRSLPDGQRRVVVLRHVIGLSPREIATQMGKTEGAVHTLHHRARRSLRRELVRRDTAPVARPRHPAASAAA
ncbi:MAG TPA: sigma-70 family RNA polymerase sigma factor [Solirubrobacterales bacterium]|nr:sigma-70 family RNA polymerase sigma factor [Solirubrobacterales bacterium]